MCTRTAFTNDLMISEIYFAGTDERVEILNQGDTPFSGVVTLSGVKSTPVVIPMTIPAQGVVVVGDTMNEIVDTQYVYAS